MLFKVRCRFSHIPLKNVTHSGPKFSLGVTNNQPITRNSFVLLTLNTATNHANKSERITVTCKCVLKIRRNILDVKESWKQQIRYLNAETVISLRPPPPNPFRKGWHYEMKGDRVERGITPALSARSRRVLTAASPSSPRSTEWRLT